MREKINKHEKKKIYKLPKIIENGWHDLDFEENMGNMQFLSVFDKKNPCINKKVDWVSILLLVSQINFQWSRFGDEKIRISKKGSVSGEKIIAYLLQIRKMWMRTIIKVEKNGKSHVRVQ